MGWRWQIMLQWVYLCWSAVFLRKMYQGMENGNRGKIDFKIGGREQKIGVQVDVFRIAIRAFAQRMLRNRLSTGRLATGQLPVFHFNITATKHAASAEPGRGYQHDGR